MTSPTTTATAAPEIVLYETAVEPVDKAGPVTRLSGRAVPYGIWTNRGWFLERVQAGALAKSIAEAATGLPLHLFHDTDTYPVGISEEWDDRKDALYGIWRLDQGPEGRRAGELARDGLLRWFSVGIAPIRSEWQTIAPDKWNPDMGPDYMDRLTRVEARLLEASLVTVPAFPTAEVLATYGARMRAKLERTDVPRRPHADPFPHRRAWAEWRRQLDAGTSSRG